MYHLKNIGEFKLGKRSIRVKIGYLLPCVTLKFDGYPWKTIWHLLYTTSSFLHHLKAGKAQFGSKSPIFLSRVNLKFGGWRWKITGHVFYTAPSFLHHFKAMGEFKLSYSSETINSGQNRRFVVSCDLEIWRMTLLNNRAPLLCCFKLCVSFHSHQWIQSGATTRTGPVWVKIDDFFSRLTLKSEGWPWKRIGQHQVLRIIPSSYSNANWSNSPKTA